jgi:hypothetical protein
MPGVDGEGQPQVLLGDGLVRQQCGQVVVGHCVVRPQPETEKRTHINVCIYWNSINMAAIIIFVEGSSTIKYTRPPSTPQPKFGNDFIVLISHFPHTNRNIMT